MDLTNYISTPLSDMTARFAEAKYNPTLLTKAALETVEAVTDGKSVIMDATSPFVLQLEMASALTAGCVQENIATLRKQYSALAQTEDDLYMHMSDADYVDRFASPVLPVSFTFCVLVQDLIREAVYDSTEKAYKLILPRDTDIVVDGCTFTLLYPVVIRYFDNQMLQISYDTSIVNPIYSLKTSLIESKIRVGTENEEWVFFNVQALQVNVSPEYATIDKTYAFDKTIDLVDKFYHARVFYKNNSTSGAWVEMATTHTEQVFNIKKPTAVLQVTSTQLGVKIPVIYTTSGLVSGSIRIDVYTTQGDISLNLQNFTQDAFAVTLKAIDEAQDASVYSEAMTNVSFYAYSLDYATGGKDAVDFEVLRNQVIHNATGAVDLPITNVRLEADAKQNGFTIVKNVDVLTNRIFLAIKKLPVPTQEKLITPANIGMITYSTDLLGLSGHYKAVDNGNRVTLLSKAVWLSDNGIVSLASKSDIDALYALGQTAMVSAINSAQYFYTPFYYVLDATGDEFEVRSYALDQPYGKDQNFIRINQTLQLAVNTASYRLDKVDAGYVLRVVTKSSNIYKALNDSEVGMQLAFYPYGQKTHAYINGTMEGLDPDGNRIFSFAINTNHDVSGSDTFCVTNAQVEGITDYQAWISLETDFKLLHYSTSISDTFIPDATDALIGKFLLPSGAVGNVHEELVLHFGDSLDNLWRRSRSSLTNVVYKKHTENIPLLYTEDVFDYSNEGRPFEVVNGELVYNYLHRKGEPVLDSDNNPILKFKVGDVVLDELGNPVIETSISVGRRLDLLVVDGRYLFGNDAATVAYRSELESLLADWIVNDLAVIEGKLLDQTEIYFYPETSVGEVEVYTENGEIANISADQSFALTLYVSKAVKENESIRTKLNRATISLLDTYLGEQTVNMTDLTEALRVLYGSSVAAFTISGLGGSNNYQLLKIASNQNRLCLKKRLAIQADKTLIVEDAVTIEYKETA